MGAALQWWGEPVRRRCAGWHRRAAEAMPAAEAPFRRLLGEKRWAALPAAVQRRFARHVAAHACVHYAGEVVECRMSRAGRLLAQAARLIIPSRLQSSSWKERSRVALRSSSGMVGNCCLAISAAASGCA